MKKKKLQHFRAFLGITAGITFAVMLLFLLWPLETVEWRLYDLRLGLWPAPAVKPSVVLVTIDDKSLNALGRWPWPRETHARLIETLTASGARVIAFDIEFAEPSRDPEADRRLAEAARRAGNVVVAVHGELNDWTLSPGYIAARSVSRPVEPIASAVSFGHINAVPDPDGVIRKGITFVATKDEIMPSLDLVTVAKYLGVALPVWDGRSRAVQFPARSIPLTVTRDRARSVSLPDRTP